MVHKKRGEGISAEQDGRRPAGNDAPADTDALQLASARFNDRGTGARYLVRIDDVGESEIVGEAHRSDAKKWSVKRLRQKTSEPVAVAAAKICIGPVVHPNSRIVDVAIIEGHSSGDL